MGEPVTVQHARHLLDVYDKVPPRERPWYYEWAKLVDDLATQLNETQLRYIEATNPGIDMDEVRRLRSKQ